MQDREPDAGAKRPRFFWSAHRVPILPGQFLESRYLKPGGISQEKLSQALGISRRRVNELVCGKRAITPDTAVRLAHFFGTDVAFWLQLQFAWDLHQARRMYFERGNAERAGLEGLSAKEE